MLLERRTASDHLLIYACIDRITGEEVPETIELLMRAGASNVNLVLSFGKKNRPVFLAFIDVRKAKIDAVFEMLVCQFNISGWHIVSTTHEYHVAEISETSVGISHNGRRFSCEVSYKRLEGTDGWSKILLENDKMWEIYSQLHMETNFSFSDFKSMVITELYRTKKKGLVGT